MTRRTVRADRVNKLIETRADNSVNNKPVSELARTLLNFKRPARRHRSATVPIIGNFTWGQGYAKMLLLPEL